MIPEIEMDSKPVKPRDWADCPSTNCKGRIPMQTRLLRWIRSYDWAMTALMPSNAHPLAAQSRELPDPYSLPATTTKGVGSC